MRASTTDANGDVYLAGSFADTITLVTTAITSTTPTQSDAFVAK
ncbi:hypothetical protein [Hymenobacter sp. 15J16-1T3B]|nr:hypothetical protein [Hymenobacter sp. 15J16-1T3B]